MTGNINLMTILMIRGRIYVSTYCSLSLSLFIVLSRSYFFLSFSLIFLKQQALNYSLELIWYTSIIINI